MKGKPWTKEEDDFIRKNYEVKLSAREIAERLDRSIGSVYMRAEKTLGMKADISKMTRQGRLSSLRKGNAWTKAEDQYLIDNYGKPDVFCLEMARTLKRTTIAVYMRAKQLGLKAPKERREEGARRAAQTPGTKSVRFKKGCVPANKGKKMPKELYERNKKYFFQQGHCPHNYVPVGTEITDYRGYLKVKVADPDVWRFRHRMIWEEANGPVPDGYMIRFKNGNKKDCRLENLELVTASYFVTGANNFHRLYPGELGNIVRLKAKIKREIQKIMEKQHGK